MTAPNFLYIGPDEAGSSWATDCTSSTGTTPGARAGTSATSTTHDPATSCEERVDAERRNGTDLPAVAPGSWFPLV